MTMAHLEVARSQTVKLNVGGRQFLTTSDTITKHSSLLSKAYEEDVAANPSSTSTGEGRQYFIDADGDLFGHVLNYLRHGAVAIDVVEPRLRPLVKTLADQMELGDLLAEPPMQLPCRTVAAARSKLSPSSSFIDDNLAASEETAATAHSIFRSCKVGEVFQLNRYAAEFWKSFSHADRLHNTPLCVGAMVTNEGRTIPFQTSTLASVCPECTAASPLVVVGHRKQVSNRMLVVCTRMASISLIVEADHGKCCTLKILQSPDQQQPPCRTAFKPHAGNKYHVPKRYLLIDNEKTASALRACPRQLPLMICSLQGALGAFSSFALAFGTKQNELPASAFFVGFTSVVAEGLSACATVACPACGQWATFRVGNLARARLDWRPRERQRIAEWLDQAVFEVQLDLDECVQVAALSTPIHSQKIKHKLSLMAFHVPKSYLSPA